MRDQFSSLEIHFGILELQSLLNSKLNKIYNPDNSRFIFEFHVPNKGKSILNIIIGKCFFFSEEKESSDKITNICQYLRKKLEGSFLRAITQIDSERIVKFNFQCKTESFILVTEFFGSGNILLCDSNNEILFALNYKAWKDREIKQHVEYSYPKKDLNLFKIDKEKLSSLSKTKELVKLLAVDLSLGGIYAEEACLNSGVNKLKKNLSDSELNSVINAVDCMIHSPLKPCIVYHNGQLLEILPIELKIYSHEKIFFEDSFLYAINKFIDKISPAKKDTALLREIERLESIIAHQNASILTLQKEVEEFKKAGDYIYENYVAVSDLVSKIKDSIKLKNEDLQKKVTQIKEINRKENYVVVEI